MRLQLGGLEEVSFSAYYLCEFNDLKQAVSQEQALRVTLSIPNAKQVKAMELS